jgi:cytochrome c-type biogenesis protein CcmE
MGNNKYKFIIGTVVIILAVLGLAFQGYQNDETVSYSKSVSELHMMGTKAYNMPLKVNGNLKKGTIVRSGMELDFVIVEGSEELKIKYIGTDPIPDTFNNEMDAEVVVSGKLNNDVFEAERIQAKCASKYEADYTIDSNKI